MYVYKNTIPAIINLTHLSEAAPLDWWELQSHGEKEKVSLSSYLLTQKISFCYDIPCLRNLSFSEKSHFSIPRPLENCPQKFLNGQKMPQNCFLEYHFQARICRRVRLIMVILGSSQINYGGYGK